MAHMDETERIALRGAIRRNQVQSSAHGRNRADRSPRCNQAQSSAIKRTWTKPSGSLDLNRWRSHRRIMRCSGGSRNLISRVSFQVGCSERRTVLVNRRCPEQSSSTKGSLVRPAQRSSVVISGHQSSSEAIRGHQRSSELIRGHQK